MPDALEPAPPRAKIPFARLALGAIALLAVIAILVVAVFVGLIVLKFVASLALSLFWPLLLITIGVGIGVWWMGRSKRA